jgi:hypothetical protein
MSSVFAGQGREHDHQGRTEGCICLHFREWSQQRRRDIFTESGFTWTATQLSKSALGSPQRKQANEKFHRREERTTRSPLHVRVLEEFVVHRAQALQAAIGHP